jgi:hypothetical protein
MDIFLGAFKKSQNVHNYGFRGIYRRSLHQNILRRTVSRGKLFVEKFFARMFFTEEFFDQVTISLAVKTSMNSMNFIL